MSETFDPYYKWLGIPPQQQPADHYRLLGIRRFESDGDVIEIAADKQMLLMKTFRTGKNAELAEVILNELSAAKACLLQPDEKAKYDAKLRIKLKRRKAESAKPEAPVPPPPPPVQQTEPEEDPFHFQRSNAQATIYKRKRKRKNSNLLLMVVLLFLFTLAAIGALFFFLTRQNQTSPEKNNPPAHRQSPPGRGGIHDTPLGIPDPTFQERRRK